MNILGPSYCDSQAVYTIYTEVNVSTCAWTPLPQEYTAWLRLELEYEPPRRVINTGYWKAEAWVWAIGLSLLASGGASATPRKLGLFTELTMNEV